MDNSYLINNMEQMLVDIYKIKDIEAIYYSDLISSVSQERRITIIPCLSIRYDGGKFLSLCSKDKYFDVFVKKVFAVYNLEKNRIVMDHELDPFSLHAHILIDDNAKVLLESGDLTKVNKSYAFYHGKKGYSESLLFLKDVFKMHLPLIEYHLKQLLSLYNISISFCSDELRGYRKNYTLDYKVDGLDDFLYLEIERMDNRELIVKIRSLNNHFKPLVLHTRFNNSNLTTSISSFDEKLYCVNKYSLSNENGVVNTYDVHQNNESIAYYNMLLDKVDNPYENLANIDQTSKLIWFKLPWNAFYGFSRQMSLISDNESIVNANNKYLSVGDNEFMIREYASHYYQRIKSMTTNATYVVMDEIGKTVRGIPLSHEDNIYLIETAFDHMLGSSGYYENNLDSRYFYHLVESDNGILGINSDNLVSISSEDDIIMPADLLIKDDVKRLLKR